MKQSKNVTRALVAFFGLSLSFVMPVMAQQEVSPDHYDSTSIQDQQVSKTAPKAIHKRVAGNTAAKKHAGKMQRAHTQTVSLKKVSS